MITDSNFDYIKVALDNFKKVNSDDIPSGLILSITDKKIDTSNTPTKFKFDFIRSCKDLEKILLSIEYCPSAFINGYRDQDNFHSADSIILDFDNPHASYTVEKTIKRIKKLKLFATIATSKSHQKEKHGEICDRYHVIIPLIKAITTAKEYKYNADLLSKLIFNEKDDSNCREAARFFFPSPENAKIYHIGDKNFNFFAPKPIPENLPIKEKIKKVTTKLPPETSENIEIYQNYLKSKGLNHIINHYNSSNKTLNLKRDENDKGPGNFMFADDNRIFDNHGLNVTSVDFSLKQIIEAEENKTKEIENLREEVKNKVFDNIDINKKFNIILTSEGVGKSRLVPSMINKFNVPRLVLLCKSYEQLMGKKDLYTKYNPNIKTEIIPSTERLLDKYNVKERVYVLDPESGEEYLSFRASILKSDISYEKKAEAFDEKNYIDSVLNGITKKDILLMTEEKFRAELVIKRNFNLTFNDLIVFDEFNADFWFKISPADKMDMTYHVRRKLKIYEAEAWENYLVPVKISKHNYWLDKFQSKAIILSTENKVPLFFEQFKEKEKNIIDERNIFYTENTTIYSINSKLINRKYKPKLNFSFLSNNYITIGNGINSKLNFTSILGQNYHGEFDNKDIVVLLSHPCPEEIVIYKENLKLDTDNAVINKLADTLNQVIGRCQGYRRQIKVKSLTILIPNNLINDLLPLLRYISPIKRTVDNENSLVERIIHTLNHTILGFKEIPNMLLKSLISRIKDFVTTLYNEGDYIINSVKSMKWFKFSKELQYKGLIKKNSKYGKMQYILKHFKECYIQYSEFFDYTFGDKFSFYTRDMMQNALRV